jgi:hypothetical protein
MDPLPLIFSLIFLALIVFSSATVLIAVLVRVGKVKFWVAMVFNVITGLLAALGISGSWALGIIPFIGLVVSSIILTWPKRKKTQ